ncbi:hypothetical protein CLOSAC_40020 [Clostridium saccharobutylicum]|uniref:Uncharacterized protein n=1 Tax=Clostridium saccharobutylicum TaxID=169679 RepID=A0A1S8MTG2_CLOSA|nr:hypothetical protein CLOSAC_40020 [Clostridium saccharobutylicum]
MNVLLKAQLVYLPDIEIVKPKGIVIKEDRVIDKLNSMILNFYIDYHLLSQHRHLSL